MELDWKVCSRARLARDPRFDGKFFIAVVSTGVYCRPICRARTSKESNVRYFPSAAAASEAGFRPCLRCRPESSPGTPAWLGTQNTVSRGLRLIEETGLEDRGVDWLAQRLGIGSRHLRRLFLRHLGATASAIWHTRRLHFAKKLIDETSLPMTQVAIASGFNGVRRFNAVIHKTYGRSPTQIRRLARVTEAAPENHYIFRLSYRPPYDWNALLRYLAARAIPGIELVAGGSYRRSIFLNGKAGHIDVAHSPTDEELILRVHFPDPQSLFRIVERIRAIFDLKADWEVIGQILRRDPKLRPLIDANPGLRVAGCWDPFELTVRAVVGQQVSVAAASTFAGRLAKTLGRPVAFGNGLTHLFPSADTLAQADLGGLGLTKARAATLRELARAVRDAEIGFERFTDTQEVVSQLLAIRGIGKWTAQYVAMRALREPDAFPADDLALLRASGLSRAAQLEELSEPWRPWRAYAAMYLWTSGSSSVLRGSAKDSRDRTTWSERNRDAAPQLSG